MSVQEKSQQTEKKPYQAPKIAVLGQLSTLTQGTASGPAEPSGGPANAKKP